MTDDTTNHEQFLKGYEEGREIYREWQREFWASGWHPLAWLRCVLFHSGTDFWVEEDWKVLRWECGTCSRPRMKPVQRECCTPEDPCGPNDPDGICRECQSYADPEDMR